MRTINLKFKTHRQYYDRRYPGIEPEALTLLTKRLFDYYSADARRLRYRQPIQWDDQSMWSYLDFKLKSTTLGLELDPGNEFGLVTERTLLRWVRDRVRGMYKLKIPFGLSDYNTIKNQLAKGGNPWDPSKVWP